MPLLYYITPQVWAWGADRLPKMAQVITKAAVILPFEEELLRAHGIDATFVGHPLLDRTAEMPSRAAARAALGVPGDATMLALFPGSRQQEILPEQWEYAIVTFQDYKGWRPRYINGHELKDWMSGPLIHEYLADMGEEAWELAAASAVACARVAAGRVRRAAAHRVGAAGRDERAAAGVRADVARLAQPARAADAATHVAAAEPG